LSKYLIQSYEMCAFLLPQQYNYTEVAVPYPPHLWLQFICILEFHALLMLFSHWFLAIHLRTIKFCTWLSKSNENKWNINSTLYWWIWFFYFMRRTLMEIHLHWIILEASIPAYLYCYSVPLQVFSLGVCLVLPFFCLRILIKK
jgi:hypothetical protein